MSFSSPVNSLPPELLRQIIHLAAIPVSTWDAEPEFSSRNAMLRCCSLVSRSWSVQAQDELWVVAGLGREHLTKAFLRQQAVRPRRTRELLLFLGTGQRSWTGMAAMRVLSASEGVEVLRLASVTMFPITALCSESMAGTSPSPSVLKAFLTLLTDLHTLRIDEGVRLMRLKPAQITHPLPFNLIRLSLLFSTKNYVSALSPLFQPSITSFRLSFMPSITHPQHRTLLQELAVALIPIAPNLLTLGITWWDDEVAPVDFGSMVPFLRACTSLVHFTSNAEDRGALEYIPSTIETWTVTLPTSSFLPEYLVPPLRQWRSLARLECLRLSDLGDERYREEIEEVDWTELEDECARRGIEVLRGDFEDEW